MSQDVLHFQCMACQASLTVPVHLAGVTGPCPKCGATVTSPQAPAQTPEPIALPPMPAMMPPMQQPVATLPQPQSYAQPQQPPVAGSWGSPEMQPQQPVAQMPPQQSYQAQPTTQPAPTMLPPRRTQPLTPVAGSLMNQQGLAGFGPAPTGMANPSAAPQWTLPGAAEPAPAPMPKREIEDPMTTILRGTGAQTTSELDNDPRNLPGHFNPQMPPQATAPAQVSMPQQAMNIRLGGKKKGGKWILKLAAVLLLGALGAAGWYFQEPIKEIVQRYFPSTPADPVTAETPTPETTPESTSKPETAPFDPLAKPTQGLRIEKPAPIIIQNATPQAKETPSVPGIPPTILSATPQPTVPTVEIKPAEAPGPLSMPEVPGVPKATIVEDSPGESASSKAQHVPGTALGKKDSGADSLVEVTPDKPPTLSIAPAPGSAQSATSTVELKATNDVLVQATPESKKAAEALQAFFAAKNLSERLPLTLGSESMKSLMERYYAKKDTGAIAVDEIKLLRFDPAPDTGGGPHCVFTVASKLWEYPIPVMLQEEGGSYKVDWLAFVEFRDNLLFEFLSGYQDMPARFHVGIRRTHYFEDDVANLDEKDCFEIQPPLPTYVGYVFVPKNTPLATDLTSRLSWDTLTAYVIVELRWQRIGEMKWVELTGVPQLNWYSFPMVPQAGPVPTPKEPAGKKNSGGVDIKKAK